MRKSLLALLSISAALFCSSSFAGGFDRGGVNIDRLFDQERFSSGVDLTYVSPQREITNVSRGTNLVGGAPLAAARLNVDGDYLVPQFGLKYSLGDSAACLASYSEPFGADASYGTNNAHSPTSVSFSIDTQDYGLTCSYSFDLGDTSLGASKLRIIAGGSYQELQGFQSRQTFLDFFNAGLTAIPGSGVTNTQGLGFFDIGGDAFGWRAGLAYEIPESAIRASFIYHSRYDYSLSGVQNNTGFGAIIPGTQVVPVTIDTEIPQAIEIKLQTGLNKSTLAFANFKWQQWSRLGVIPIVGGRSPVTGAGTNLSFDPLYRDGYTISAGLGRQFSDSLAGRLALGWDRGTSTISGTQTDTWTVSGGVRWNFNENLEFNAGGLVGLLTSGNSSPSGGDPANNISFNFGSDLLLAGNASFKLKF